ncbi:MAG: hypothetical protein KDD66_14580 [Bdellovibrionales bacterium]|nr:hypothetical protein [Bdellovibrionales bacterium]
MPSTKTIPLSVRVSEEDAEFIATLEVVGAKTPSEKLRTIISEARRRAVGKYDYGNCLAIAKEMVAPIVSQIRETEHATQTHSEFLAQVGEWMPDMLAYLMTTLDERTEENDESSLSKFEKGVADRVFTLIENVLRLGVTSQSRCYDANLISNRLQNVVDLVSLISQRQQSEV